MASSNPRFVCQECGHEAHKWMGKCAGCGAWNTLVREEAATEVEAQVPDLTTDAQDNGTSGHGRPERLTDVEMEGDARLRTGIEELDRVMGGGIMQGSFSLIAGDPGIGKSTLMTELAGYLPGHSILYVTGEESKRQVKLRAQRLEIDSDNLYLLAETNVQQIAQAVEDVGPDLLIVDSIQTIYRPDLSSAPGSVSQVRESTASLLKLTKEQEFSTFLVGHVTKKGTIAGPRVLEHMVDTVLHFEGNQSQFHRLLRSVKNRFGPAQEVGVFEMKSGGLYEVTNPSELFLSDLDTTISGNCVTSPANGKRI